MAAEPGFVIVAETIGGWITAEMVLLGSTRISRIVLVDAMGIDVADHPVVDFFGLTLDQVTKLSYHDPDSFRIDPSAMPAEQQAVMAGNRATLAVYGGASMSDPGLAPRLAGITVPALVLWGDSDQIADPSYGRAYAAAIPGARFQLLPTRSRSAMSRHWPGSITRRSSSAGRSHCPMGPAAGNTKCLPREAGHGLRPGTRFKALTSARWTRGSSRPAKTKSSCSGSSEDAAQMDSTSTCPCSGFTASATASSRERRCSTSTQSPYLSSSTPPARLPPPGREAVLSEGHALLLKRFL